MLGLCAVVCRPSLGLCPSIRFGLGLSLACFLLCRRLHPRPRLPSRRLRFSRSHSNGLVLGFCQSKS